MGEAIDPVGLANALRRFGKKTRGLTLAELRRESDLFDLVGRRTDLSEIVAALLSTRTDPTERLIALAALGMDGEETGGVMMGRTITDRIPALTFTEPSVGRTRYFDQVDGVLLRLAEDLAAALALPADPAPSLSGEAVQGRVEYPPNVLAIFRLIYDHGVSLGRNLLALHWAVEILDARPHEVALRRRRPGPNSKRFDAACEAAVDYVVLDFWLRRLDRIPEGRSWFENWEVLDLDDGMPGFFDLVEVGRPALAGDPSIDLDALRAVLQGAADDPLDEWIAMAVGILDKYERQDNDRLGLMESCAFLISAAARVLEVEPSGGMQGAEIAWGQANELASQEIYPSLKEACAANPQVVEKYEVGLLLLELFGLPLVSVSES